jgi:hypothetical protein
MRSSEKEGSGEGSGRKTEREGNGMEEEGGRKGYTKEKE